MTRDNARRVFRRGGVALVLASVGLLPACSAAGSSWLSADSSTPPPSGVVAAPPSAVASSASPRPAARSTATAAPEASAPVATDSPGPQPTDVVLGFAGWNPATVAVEAGGYVSPLVESGGTCTLLLTKAGRTVTASSPGEPDASTTVCGNLAVPGTKLTAGSWTAVLRYSSARATGSSSPITVAVPQ